MKASNKNLGFTLIEMVIYSALLAMISILTINAVLAMSRAADSFRGSRNIGLAADSGIERMVRDLRSATLINDAGSTFGANPGVLNMDIVDPDTSASSTVQFYLSGTALVRRLGGAVQILTASTTEVTSLVFRKLTTAKSQAIRMEMTLRSGRGVSQKTENFYDTVVLRGSY
jgi:type II secretory pathway pseudopilin PulG